MIKEEKFEADKSDENPSSGALFKIASTVLDTFKDLAKPLVSVVNGLETIGIIPSLTLVDHNHSEKTSAAAEGKADAKASDEPQNQPAHPGSIVDVLSDPNSSPQDKLGAIYGICVLTGQKHYVDTDGNKYDISIEMKGKNTLVSLHTVDDKGRSRAVLRGTIDKGGNLRHQHDDSGNEVNFVSTYASQHMKDNMLVGSEHILDTSKGATPKHGDNSAKDTHPAAPVQTSNDRQRIANQNIPESTAANQSIPESTVANQSISESNTADQCTTESTVANQSVPESNTADQCTTESTVANQSVPESNTADQCTTESTVANQSVPESNTADQCTTESTVANQSVPESTVANQSITESVALRDSDHASDTPRIVQQDVPALDVGKFSESAKRIFSQIDRNGNGYLNKEELAKAVQDPQFKGQDAQVLSALYNNYDALRNIGAVRYVEYRRGLSQFNLNEFGKIVEKQEGNQVLAANELALVHDVNKNLYHTSLSQKAGTCYDLYRNPSDSLESIKPEAAIQGTVGDCYYEAPLSAVARATPSLIQKAIKDNGNDTYTVTFPGAPDEPITVSAPTETEMGLYNQGSKNGIWASVMEKSYGQYCHKHVWRRSINNLLGGDTPQEGAEGGGEVGRAMKLLTGKEVHTIRIDPTLNPKDLAKTLTEAFSAYPPKPVTAQTGGYGNVSSSVYDDKHAYTILNFWPDDKSGGIIQLRDPRGHQKDTVAGISAIPLDEFLFRFSEVTYSD